ncbi:MAG: lipase [Clostridia bacterium]|nr:lipase [Clostridia bacterium]
MKLVCFGDSNTYGYTPNGADGGRYPASVRWVDRLAAATGFVVQNEGQNGRAVLDDPLTLPPDTDLLLLMLGSNDLLLGADAVDTADRLRTLLTPPPIAPQRILLIAPPPMQRGSWVGSRALVLQSRLLHVHLCALANRLGTAFANAGDWGITLGEDGVHFTEEGHRAFAEGVLRTLNEMIKGIE